jgi:hypothetical protein
MRRRARTALSIFPEEKWMIEKKISKGGFIDFGSIAAAQTCVAGTGQVNYGVEDRQIGDSSRENFYNAKHRAVGAGSHATKAGRNFKWLPWADNGINYAESQGNDVLSGPFSGCYMVIYTYGGVRRIGHIATPGAKAAWNALVAADPQIQVVGGVRPDTGYKNELPKGNDSRFNILGLVTADSKFYAVMTFLQGGSNESRIAAIRKMDSLSVATLSALP